ncbi:hypothetical protein DV736_g6512, partial [Chaetothyriales sp. CBS 134916]
MLSTYYSARSQTGSEIIEEYLSNLRQARCATSLFLESGRQYKTSLMPVAYIIDMLHYVAGRALHKNNASLPSSAISCTSRSTALDRLRLLHCATHRRGHHARRSLAYHAADAFIVKETLTYRHILLRKFLPAEQALQSKVAAFSRLKSSTSVRKDKVDEARSPES